MTAAVFTTLTQRLHHLTTGDGLKARLIRGGLGSAGIPAANRVLTLALGIVLVRALGAEGYGIYACAIMGLLMVAAEAGGSMLLMREVAASQAGPEWGVLRGVIRRAGHLVAVGAAGMDSMQCVYLWSQCHGRTREMGEIMGRPLHE